MKRMSMTAAIKAASVSVRAYGAGYCVTDENGTHVGDFRAGDDRVKALRDMRAEYAVGAMYGPEAVAILVAGDTLRQPGSLRDIVRLAVADIERAGL